jgi:aminopeptidase N
MDVANLRRVQFPEDRGSLAHPVQPKSYQEINNFYTATVYEKGGEIVRMYEVMLGQDGFRRGMDLYFERHDGQAVTIEDFLAAMEDANHIDLKQFKRWYDEIGTPVVVAQEFIDDDQIRIELEQFSKEPLLIPIRFRVYDKAGMKVDLPDLLLFKEKKQSFEFRIPHPNVVVNYLQGFSAPIILKRNLKINEKLEILNLEQDGFAVWDLKQDLFIHFIHDSYHTSQAIKLPQPFLEMMQRWIHKKSFTPQVLTELFSMPSFEECLVGLQNVNPIALEEARASFENALGTALFKEFSFQERLSVTSVGDRAWNNLCLHYQMLANSKLMASKSMAHFRLASNMTDRMGGLKPLVITNDKHQMGKLALEQFFVDWEDQELVMDKWFALQARFLPLVHVNQLLIHPLFNWENPNKVRALIGTFTQNINYFHAMDGSGYQWLVDAILKLDKLNPQVAARMVVPLTRWDWLDTRRQKMIWQQLAFLLEQKTSSNLFEMVSKSLPTR